MTAQAPIGQDISAQVVLTGWGDPIKLEMIKSQTESARVTCGATQQVTCDVTQVESGTGLGAEFNVALNPQ